MTQTEINKKIKELEESVGINKSTLEKLVQQLQESETLLAAVREKLQGEHADPQVIQDVANLETLIKNVKAKKEETEKVIASQEQSLKEYKTMTPVNDVSDVNTENVMTQADKEKNAKLAAEHPERVVDGIYYSDDAALAKAKAAQEERLKAETQQATAEATAKANKLAAAMKKINETLYGTDNAEVLTQLQGSVGGAELSSVLGNAVSVRARQHLLDFKKFAEDFKAPNSGKPPHNKDPFPVDLKIEELETHQPRVKVHEIVTHNHGKAAAIMGIQQFHATEQRIVRLENNMATVLRYLYRLGSRVFINCQYYGQNKISKY